MTTAETSFATFMETATRGFELVGALTLVVGFVWSLALAVHVWRQTGDGRSAYQILRQAFGGTILLGLEILVAADLVRTVAIEPTLNNVSVLGLIVLIRTFLSFSLEIEIEGIPPWRRALMTSGAQHVVKATASARGAAPRQDTFVPPSAPRADAKVASVDDRPGATRAQGSADLDDRE
jgi:uncharacterized membrane protein